MIGASAIGTSHITSNTPCQDHFESKVIVTRKGPVLAVVVCDGAGSASHADIGARLAATTLIELIELHYGNEQPATANRDCAVEWLTAVADALAAHADVHERRLRDYACTVLAAIVGVDEACFLQVGDGAIVVSHGEEDGWSYVFWPQHGEFANTTNFVISRDLETVVEFEHVERRIDEFAVFSDGIENLVLQPKDRCVHSGFFNSMIQPVRALPEPGFSAALSDSLATYLSSPVICDRTDDDKTLFLGARQGASGTAPVE